MFNASIDSDSNNITNLFDCQLNHKQINYCHEFLKDNLTNSQFRVFNTLMQLTVAHRSVRPSYKYLAKVSQCARSTAQEAVRRLKELNIIQTEYQGYHQTLTFRMHQFYYKKRSKLSSLVRNVVDQSLFFLLLSWPKKENRYLLKEKVVYLNQSTFSGDKSMAFQLTDQQFTEIRKHPAWVYERSLNLYQRKVSEGIAIASPSSYFMGIFKQEAARAHSPEVKQPFIARKKEPETGKKFVRPKDGPYSVYKHEERPEQESDFVMALKMRKALVANPTNIFLEISVNAYMKKLSIIEQQQIDDMVNVQ